MLPPRRQRSRTGAGCSPNCWSSTSRHEEDPKQTTTADNELIAVADDFAITGVADLFSGPARGIDMSNPVIAVDHDSCILCDRCVRACDDIQANNVIGRSGKGYSTRIAFDLNDPMGAVVLRHMR